MQCLDVHLRLFSHQDATIAEAISSVMPDTCHALSTLYLKQTAKLNLKHLIRGDCNFMKEFKACINDYEEEIELITSWAAMMNKYSIHGNVWLEKVFEENKKMGWIIHEMDIFSWYEEHAIE
jgi:zinc finger SWIM domain-containing protein 3